MGAEDKTTAVAQQTAGRGAYMPYRADDGPLRGDSVVPSSWPGPATTERPFERPTRPIQLPRTFPSRCGVVVVSSDTGVTVSVKGAFKVRSRPHRERSAQNPRTSACRSRADPHLRRTAKLTWQRFRPGSRLERRERSLRGHHAARVARDDDAIPTERWLGFNRRDLPSFVRLDARA